MDFLTALNSGQDMRRASNHNCKIPVSYMDMPTVFIDFSAFVDDEGECLVDKEDLMAKDWETVDFYGEVTA